MPEPITISFVATKKLKQLIEQWAQEDDRSVSYIIRQILAREAHRRAAEAQKREAADTQEQKRPELLAPTSLRPKWGRGKDNRGE